MRLLKKWLAVMVLAGCVVAVSMGANAPRAYSFTYESVGGGVTVGPSYTSSDAAWWQDGESWIQWMDDLDYGLAWFGF